MIFENFEITLVLLGQFQNIQKYNLAIYPKSQNNFDYPKTVIIIRLLYYS